MLRGSTGPEPSPPPVRGRARLGRRTKELVKRLGAEDIAVIDHADIDRVSAEELVRNGTLEERVPHEDPAEPRRDQPVLRFDDGRSVAGRRGGMFRDEPGTDIPWL